jgi:hypothetical protein
MRYILLILALVIGSAVVYSFAAANVVPETGAGEGSGTVSGYTITNVDYNLLSSNPAKLASITFDAAPTSGAGAAGEVKITVDAGTTWIACTGPAGNTWTCTFGSGSEPSVSSISSLKIVAVD